MIVWVAGEYVSSNAPRCIGGEVGTTVPCWSTFLGSMSMQPFSMSIIPATLSMAAPSPGSVATKSANLTITSHAFSGQITLSNNPNFTSMLSGPILTYSQTSFNVTQGQIIMIRVSISICSSTPSRTFTITGTSRVFTNSINFTVTITGQRSGSCPD